MLLSPGNHAVTYFAEGTKQEHSPGVQEIQYIIYVTTDI